MKEQIGELRIDEAIILIIKGDLSHSFET